MLNYYNSLAQKYKGYHIEQIQVYTGDSKFKSPIELKHRKNSNSYRLVDLTQLDLKKLFAHPHFGIQFLCIFNHKMPKKEKVRFIVDSLNAFVKQYGREKTQFIINLLPLAMTKKTPAQSEK